MANTLTYARWDAERRVNAALKSKELAADFAKWDAERRANARRESSKMIAGFIAWQLQGVK